MPPRRPTPTGRPPLPARLRAFAARRLAAARSSLSARARRPATRARARARRAALAVTGALGVLLAFFLVGRGLRRWLGPDAPAPAPAATPSVSASLPSGPAPPIAGPTASPSDAGWESALLDAHNARRAAEGLGPLALETRLTAAARSHARDMARRRAMGHDGSDGSNPGERVRRVGYDFQATAENVAVGYARPDDATLGWFNSPGHRRNMLGPYTECGFGWERGPDGRIYWCTNFGTPRPGP